MQLAVTDQASAETALLGVYSYLGDYGVFSAYYLVDDAYRLWAVGGDHTDLQIMREIWKLCLFLLNTGNCWKNGNCVGK